LRQNCDDAIRATIASRIEPAGDCADGVGSPGGGQGGRRGISARDYGSLKRNHGFGDRRSGAGSFSEHPAAIQRLLAELSEEPQEKLRGLYRGLCLEYLENRPPGLLGQTKLESK
jgi:hypothetical protein